MKQDSLIYLTTRDRDEDWGITVRTVGFQVSEPHTDYPPLNHPNIYIFNPHEGRVLDEYQLLYITRGEGYFRSKSCPLQKVQAGTIIMLFPGEWHSYYPNPDTGWKEYWVGFKGHCIDQRVENHFFTKENPIYIFGINTELIDMYKSILDYANGELCGYQQISSSITLHILGLLYFHQHNNTEVNSIALKINEARRIMKQNIEKPLPPEDIADMLGLGYTWFRRMFKEHTGVSPARYQTNLRLLVSKELLTNTTMRVNEIAYKLNFESGSQFATFFKKLESVTPSEYRDKTRKAFIEIKQQ